MNFREITTLLPILAEDHTSVGGQKVTCYLGFDNKFVFGYNRYKSHPIQKKYGKKPACIFLHAEIDSICKFVSKYVEIWRATLYICRLSLGDLALSKPCKGCERAIVAFNIKHVYFSTPYGFEKYW